MNNKTHWKKLYNPDYFGSWVIIDKGVDEMNVVFTEIYTDEVKTERGSDSVLIAKIKGEKPLILNSTNCTILSKIFSSPFIEDWINKPLTLYVKNIKAFGEVVPAVRVKEKLPTKDRLTFQHKKWADAIEAVQSGKTTLPQIEAVYFVPKEEKEFLAKLNK